MRQVGKALGTLACLLLWSGCGYKSVHTAQELGPDAHGIAIGMFENQSNEPGVERLLADSLHEEFVRRGRLAVFPAESGTRTDLVMLGTIRDVVIHASAFSSVALTIEDRVELVLDVSVMPTSGDEAIWRSRELRVSERFLASGDPQVYESNKEQALRRLAAEVAGRIHDELTVLRAF